MTGPMADKEANDLQEIYKYLKNADVVEGPPELREMVAELWPEMLHKIKPPVSEMLDPARL